MELSFNNPKNLPTAVGGYSQSVVLTNYQSLAFISGQIPESLTGEVPAEFEKQCSMVWTHISNLLKASNMTIKNLVKITTYLTHRDQAETNSTIRNSFLGDHRPALTVVVVDTLDPKWLLEIDAIAAM